METFQIQYIGNGKRYMLIMGAKNEAAARDIMESALKNEFDTWEITRILKL